MMSVKILAAVTAALLVASSGLASAATVKRTAHATHQRHYEKLYGYAPDAPSAAPGAPGTTYDAPPYHYGWVPPASGY